MPLPCRSRCGACGRASPRCWPRRTSTLAPSSPWPIAGACALQGGMGPRARSPCSTAQNSCCSVLKVCWAPRLPPMGLPGGQAGSAQAHADCAWPTGRRSLRTALPVMQGFSADAGCRRRRWHGVGVGHAVGGGGGRVCAAACTRGGGGGSWRRGGGSRRRRPVTLLA